ncbi:MAG TPA: protein Mom, partial [Thermoanaerobaculia bacterium]|nr:protein Mom [Thermoanaerobaculia bacterium]
MTLRLDFCTHEAAKYAVMRWHYSRRMPKSKLVRIGVWEDEKFSGAVIFGLGANRHLARPFDLEGTQVCELVRVALAPGRRHPTSQVVAVSLKLLKRQSPGLRLIVSYADLGEGHVGTIYQAGGWLYLGTSEQGYLKIHGRIVHPRTVYDRYGPGGQSVPWLQSNVDPNAAR